MGEADLVVSGWDATTALAEEIEDLPGVEAVYTQIVTFEDINFNGRHEYTLINTPAPTEKLEVITIGEGEMPAHLNEIALSQGSMEIGRASCREREQGRGFAGPLNEMYE